MRKAAGTAHLISRDMAGALLAFQQAARAAHAAGVSALEAAALSNVALVCQQTNKPAEALLYMRQSALLDSTFEDDPASLSNRGVVLWSVGQLAEAARTYQKALTIACRQGSAYVEAVVRCNLAHTYIDLGRIAEALRLLDDALAGYRTVGSVYGESIALWLSAAAHAASSAHDHALDEADRAIALAEDNGYQRVEGDARCTRGGILAALGQHDQAAAEFEQAAELAAAVDSVEVRVAALVGLASVRSGHDGSEAALTLANQAVDEAARCGFRLLLGRGLAVRAAIYRQLNREDLADTDASMAAEMRRETGVPAW